MKKENTVNEKPVLVGAAKLMEDVFESGLYREMKTAENKLDTIKGTLRKKFKDGESKRYELSHNLVAKFVPSPVYETDEVGLKEFLDDLGILTKTVTLKAKVFKEEPATLELLKPFRKPIEYFAQFYLNNNGKQHIDKEEYDFNGSLEHLVINFKQQKSCLERKQSRYKEIMRKIGDCPFLRQSRSVKSNYGTCKLREKDIEFYTDSIYKQLGNDFLIKHGQVSMKLIDSYIEKGYFSPKEIQSYRKIIDINLRFVVMDQTSEQKQAEFFHQQLQRKAQKRQFA
jgi:hypothetical protein